MLDPGLYSAAGFAAASQEKLQEAEDGVELQEGEAPPAKGAVTIAPMPGPPGAFAEWGLQYQFRSERNGSQVTYRVVQVAEVPLDAPEATAVGVVSSFAGTPQVLQNPFSNGGSPGEGGPEAWLTWGGEGAVAVQADPALAQARGQFNMMMAPQEVLQAGGGTPHVLGPRSQAYSPKQEGLWVPQDERRRAQHKEVERWRRYRISNLIMHLSKIIPNCGANSGKSRVSQGEILSKACDYVWELRQSNQRLQETFKEAKRLQMANDLLRQQVEELKRENVILRAQLQQWGLDRILEGTPQ